MPGVLGSGSWPVGIENSSLSNLHTVYNYISIPVVPHKAVAEVSKIGKL